MKAFNFNDLPHRIEHLIIRNKNDNNKVRNQFNIKKFIHSAELQSDKNLKRRIKVRIYFTASFLFNAIDSLCTSFLSDPYIDLLIIVDSNLRVIEKKRTCQLLKSKQINYCIEKKYRIEKDRPDILIHTHPYHQNRKIISKYCRTIIAMPFTIVEYGQAFENTLKDYFMWLQPDYIILDDYIGKLLKGHFGKKEIVLLSNPKYDLIYTKINSDLNRNDTWRQKISQRKVILWTTTHGVERTMIDSSITFHIYAQTILKWFSDHNNCVLLFRPHPGFFAELIRNGIWTKEDADSIKKMFMASENMILDVSPDYGEAYSVSDAVMTEACGILLSYLPTRKPILYLKQPGHGKEGYQDQKLVENYYIGDNKSKIIEYLEMIMKGEDYLYEERMKTLNDTIPNFDGNNGSRMKEYIINRYIKENKKRIQKNTK